MDSDSSDLKYAGTDPCLGIFLYFGIIRIMTKSRLNGMNAQRRIGSVWLSTRSDQSFPCVLNGYAYSFVMFVCLFETLRPGQQLSVILGRLPGLNQYFKQWE